MIGSIWEPGIEKSTPVNIFSLGFQPLELMMAGKEAHRFSHTPLKYWRKLLWVENDLNLVYCKLCFPVLVHNINIVGER